LPGLEGDPNGAARAGGFSLHAGVDIAANQREQLERLCRYVSRPPVASERLALTASGQVRYRLKTRSRRRGFSFWVAWRAAAAKKRKTFSGKKQN
jgi:hypothetical protein